MKKLILTALLCAAPIAAQAQTANSQLTGLLTQLGTAYASSNTGSSMSVEQFNSLKSQILQKTNARIAQLQREQRCGQAATTPDTLNSCYAADTPISTGQTTTTTTNSQYMTQGSNLLQQYGSQYLHR